MAKLHQNELVLDHTPAGDGSFNLWSSCRRKIIDAMRCSGGISRNQKSIKSPAVADIPKLEEAKTSISECRSDSTIKSNGNHKGSEKLSTLMRMSETSPEEEQRVKLKEVVRRLQSGGDGDALGGAREVRELTKDDSQSRTNLALLGAIPPLVAMLDSDDLHSQISALYALLNLGIGNDL